MTVLVAPERAHSVAVAAEDQAAVAAQRELVERARHDRDAFAVLYRRYVRPVYAFVYRRAGSRDAAEEITAATFERALRAMPGFAWKGGGFEPWLYRIAANEVVAYYRRQRRPETDRAQRALREMAAELAEDEMLADFLRAGEHEARVARLRSALATINPRYQQAISLRYLAGLDADDAAAAMGCTKPVLAVTLHRALGALRRAIGSIDQPEDAD